MRIFEYSLAGIHPSVARALYNGQLFLSDRPELGIHHDFEFHNGALYTHWGYGVPLLQMPFHLLATAFSSGPGFHPFPDRAIFLFYLLLGTALFWLALRRLVERGFRLGEWAGSALATAKTHLPELLTGVEEREEEIVVTRKGKPAAVLVNFAEYERLKATLDVLSDPALMRQIRRSRRYFAAGGQGLSFEEVFGEPLRPTRKRRR